MPRRLIAAGFLLATLSVGCCGTLTNTVLTTPEEGGGRVYGGVRLDCERIREEITTDPKTSHHCGLPRELQILFFAIDLPSCVFGDTVILPVNIVQALRSWRSKSAELPEPDGPDPNR